MKPKKISFTLVEKQVVLEFFIINKTLIHLIFDIQDSAQLHVHYLNVILIILSTLYVRFPSGLSFY